MLFRANFRAKKNEKTGEENTDFQICVLLRAYAQKTAKNLRFRRTFFQNILVKSAVLYYTIYKDNRLRNRMNETGGVSL